MENKASQSVVEKGPRGGVREQGILNELIRKERNANRIWKEKWSFYEDVPAMRREEALKIGMSQAEYEAAVRSLSGQPAPRAVYVRVDPSPGPLPPTASGQYGRRARCPLERYGRLVRSQRDYPTRPPLPPGQVYDPYKQTFIFLGIDVPDPITYKLPSAHAELPAEAWARPQTVAVSPLCELLQRNAPH